MEKNKEKIKIVTHDGGFHADDVFAVATLLLVLEKEGQKYEIVRTRDKEVISGADYVIDVGDVYDPAKNRFDHHQPEGAGKRVNNIPYASFGLIWKTFGDKVTESSEVTEILDNQIVTPIDAVDNGIELVTYTSGTVLYTVSSMIGAFTAKWNEDADTVNNANFLKILDWAKDIISREVKNTQSTLKVKDKVKKAYEEATDKRLIVLDGAYPANDVLQKYPEPLFVIRPRQDGKWGAKSIRDDNSEFTNRKDFPSAWAGLRDTALQNITGVNDAMFCHKGLFMVVTETKEGAIALAKLALEN